MCSRWVVSVTHIDVVWGVNADPDGGKREREFRVVSYSLHQSTFHLLASFVNQFENGRENVRNEKLFKNEVLALPCGARDDRHPARLVQRLDQSVFRLLCCMGSQRYGHRRETVICLDEFWCDGTWGQQLNGRNNCALHAWRKPSCLQHVCGISIWHFADDADINPHQLIDQRVDG